MSTNRDALMTSLHDSLNKKHKGNKVAYFLDDDIDTPTDVGS